MNFVFFKVDALPYQKNHQVSFYLKSVELLRDGDIIATPGDIHITSLPYYYFCMVPTGFRKIEFRLKNNPPARISCSVGYLKSGEYLVDTPDGEIILPFNAMNGLWTLDRTTQATIDHRDFLARRFTLLRPVKTATRNTSVN